MERTSTIENPLFSIWFKKASFIARLVFKTPLGLLKEVRSAKVTPSKRASISKIFNGLPSFLASRPSGVVAVF